MVGSFGVKPDFLIIGAARSGTTSMARYLAQNPRIYMAPGETHYFDFKHTSPVEWYFRRFRKGMVNGEHSPYYFTCAEFARRAAKVVPDAKILALCREPIARAYSHYSRNRTAREEGTSFVMALEVEHTRIDRYVKRGLFSHAQVRRFSYARRGQYADRLAEWLQCYPREQIMAIKSEDFFADMYGVVGSVCDWLGVERHDFRHRRHQGQNYDRTVPDHERARLAGLFEDSNKRLAAEWGIEWAQ